LRFDEHPVTSYPMWETATMIRFLAAYAAMRVRSASFWFALAAAFSVASAFSTARADITPVGDVSSPEGPPSAWTNWTVGYIGNTGSGTLTVDGGSSLLSFWGGIGYNNSATGVVNVAGSGSTWTSGGGVSVGYYGSGSLSISGGGSVSCGNGAIAYDYNSTGLVMVDGPGSVWSSDSDVGVGSGGGGTLSITNGGSVRCNGGEIGLSYGSTGFVAVDGAGSTWTSTGMMYVGQNGSATLAITNGGSVSVTGPTYVGAGASTALIDFGANGGTLTTQSLMASPDQLAGTGTVIANGIVSDADLRFDSAHPLKQTVAFQQPGQNVAVNLDMGTNPNANGTLGAGWRGAGSLTIQDGITVQSGEGYLGYGQNSMGVATVKGSGSTWAVGGSLYLGYSGAGTLCIADGGSVSVTEATYFGVAPYATAALQFGAGGGTLTTKSLYGSPSQMSGTGTIVTRGLVTDGDLRFDAAHGLIQTVPFQQAGQDISVHLDMGTDPASNGVLGAGMRGAGSLTIRDQRQVSSDFGFLGYGNNSAGVATISGSGSAWTAAYGLFVGYDGAGTLSIADGGNVSSAYSSAVGYGPDSIGAVTVDGPGSRWNSGALTVGLMGRGELSITNGGSVSSDYRSDIAAFQVGSRGAVTVDGAGSAWTCSGTISVGGNGCGTLLITNGGSVTSNGGGIGAGWPPMEPSSSVTVAGSGSAWTNNGNLVVCGMLSVLNGGHVSSAQGVIGDSYSSVGSVTVDGIGSTWTNSGSLTVGGALLIAHGGSVTSHGGSVTGGSYGGTGAAKIDGVNSTWTNSGGLVVGAMASSCGVLSISNGGHVTSSGGTITGSLFNSTSRIAVDGSGSNWTNTGNLVVGYLGNGTASISGGGAVTTSSLTVNNGSRLAIDVGRGSSLTVGGGTGAIENSGVISIVAGAGVPADGAKYSPIAAQAWGGGAYVGVGGKWDVSDHTFTASGFATGTSGSPVALDLASVQRVLIADSGPGGSGRQVGASFAAPPGTYNITFTATAMDSTVLDVLRSQLPTGESVVSGWAFAATAYSVMPANPVYLSFEVGPGRSADELDLWHYDGGEWSQYAPTDLTYDGTFASFTATSFSGYAFAAVPEPGTLAMLAAVFAGILVWTRRKRG
jgi:T5SS/PEP-CTERM-associated repeat protein